MKQIVSNAGNYFLMPRGGVGDDVEPYAEVVLTTAEKKYHLVDSDDMATSIVHETFRFVATADVLRKVAKSLLAFADGADALFAEVVKKGKGKKEKTLLDADREG